METWRQHRPTAPYRIKTKGVTRAYKEFYKRAVVGRAEESTARQQFEAETIELHDEPDNLEVQIRQGELRL
jgi:hypothetical protein